MTTEPKLKHVRRIVVTGGPGAGKTAVLELARRHFCEHVMVLPEAAGIVFRGGFPRLGSGPALRAAQRAIYRVQCELEAIALASEALAAVLCDRGTLDGLAYWPGSSDEFLAEVGTSKSAELSRYDAVIQLKVPANPAQYVGTALRRETHQEALAIEARLLEVWADHPCRVIINGTSDFMEKSRRALAGLERAMGPHDCVADAALALRAHGLRGQTSGPCERT